MSHLTTAALALADTMQPDVHFPQFIVGGTTAKPGQFKFYTAYSRAGTVTPFCGGSLIAKTWALTAAHCNSNADASDFQVRVSAFELSKISEGEEVRVLNQVITSPDYNPSGAESDYGLLGWEKEVDFPEIELFNSDVFAQDPKPLTVIGLGRDKGGSSSSRAAELQQAQLDFVTDEDCAKVWPKGPTFSFDVDTMICAAYPTRSACQGDSGGPLFFEEAGKQKQVGVVSWGNPQCGVGVANVYARLTPQVLEFIELTIES